VTISEQLKKAAESSGLTPYKLAKDSGVALQMLTRFLSGEREIRMSTADKLCETLGLELVPKGGRKSKRSGK
jgi:transcriptional regulator with XRE-family HTH domain